jgi:peptidyl-prolyl cis-trans isomerase A (cyclophilin A)
MKKLLRSAVGLLVLAAGCAKAPTSPATPTPEAAPAPAATSAPAGKTPYAVLDTNKGKIVVRLFPEAAPKTVDNFLGLATGKKAWTDPKTGQQSSSPLYNGTIFHRVIPGFMIQGGDPLGTGTGGPGYTFDDELHPELSFDQPYLLAMANAGLRRDPVTGKVGGTNGSQFFISVAATTWLNGKHTIFGRVADDESRAVVDAIAAARTVANDRPAQDITITSVSVEE